MSVDTPTVLVVDDDRATRCVLARDMDSQGYPVLTAGNGEEALRILNEKDVALVLLDIMMPDIDGLQVLRWIRLNRPDIIVVMISGLAMEDVAQVALRMGASDYVSKPIDLDYLDTLIQVLLAWREA